jgi:hypothetical protein
MRGCLITTVCIFGILQWTVGRRVVTQSIFDHRHDAILHSFEEFRAALQAEVLRQCASSNIRHIYFDDLDVGLPYVVNAALANPSCQLIRSTPVTPIALKERARCSAITIRERHITAWASGIAQSDLGEAASMITLLREWTSGDGDFGFDVYRGRACADTPENPSR